MNNLFCNIAATMLDVARFSAHFRNYLQGFFSWVVKRATSSYSTRFAACFSAMLENKLQVFCCPFCRIFTVSFNWFTNTIKFS